MKRLIKLVVLLLLVFKVNILLCQDKAEYFTETIERIKTELKSGNKQAINELISYTDDKTEVMDNLGYHFHKSTISVIAYRTLTEYIMLSPTDYKKYEQNWKLFKKDILANFSKINFNATAQAFTWKNFSTIKIDAQFFESPNETQQYSKILLDEYTTDFKNELIKYPSLRKDEDLTTIALLRCPEAEQFIKACLSKEFIDKYKITDTSTFYKDALYTLRYFPSIENAKLALTFGIEGKISTYDALECATAISCIDWNEKIDDSTRYCEEALAIIDKFNTAEEMRRYGYEDWFDIRRTDFDSDAEFYATIVIKAMDLENNIFIGNALNDLVSTHNPECLKYLAALHYRQRSKYNDYYFPQNGNAPDEIIKEITGMTILIANEKGNYSADFSFDAFRLNYFIFWNNNYKDFSWNEEKKQFVNTKLKFIPVSKSLSAFRSLNSKINANAYDAFLKLTEAEPTELANLIKTEHNFFTKAVDNSRTVFPTFSDKRLLNLAELTSYCRKYGHQYKITGQLKLKLDSLLLPMSYAKRYKLENSIIKDAKANDLTGIEYWCAITPENATYSIGRILDKLYTKHSSEIISNQELLKLHLKKSAVYDRFGIIGVCNKYLWKLDSYKVEIKTQLTTIQKNEKDKDILESIKKLQSGSYWQSACKGDYRFPSKDIKDYKKIVEVISANNAKERENMYFEMQANVSFMDLATSGQIDQNNVKLLSDSLHNYAERNMEEEYKYESAEPFSLWLNNAAKPIQDQLQLAYKIEYGVIKKKLINSIVLQAKYKDIPFIVEAFNNKDLEQSNYFIESHLQNDLGIPVNLNNNEEVKIMLDRFANMTEIEFYKSYFIDFGLENCFDIKGKPIYDNLYEMLEYDVVDGFVGGGGGREAMAASLAVRYLELDQNTLLDFHWRMEYIEEGYVHSFYERSCAWMKYMRDNNLLSKPLPKVKSFSN